jgi:hypothetical protein
MYVTLTFPSENNEFSSPSRNNVPKNITTQCHKPARFIKQHDNNIITTTYIIYLEFLYKEQRQLLVGFYVELTL